MFNRYRASLVGAIMLSAAAAQPSFMVPTTRGIKATQLGLVVNDKDPQSVEVGAAYVAARKIPVANVVHVSFARNVSVMSVADFSIAKAAMDTQLEGTDVQVLALAWTWPYRVDCMSVTSAFALGYNKTLYCKSGGTCSPTAATQYFNSSSVAPFTDFGIRPAMLLAGWSASAVIRTIATGVRSDGTRPNGNGYMYLTTDHVRSCRRVEFEKTAKIMAGELNMSVVNCSSGQCPNYMTGMSKILTYFESLTRVPNLTTNTFLPGAVGDTLTSYSGILTNTSGQMPCVEYLAAGATGSFGTVVEPCAFTEKFPDPSVMMPHYYSGDTLVEAYWKSVMWPGEGLFVGEPLANPWIQTTRPAEVTAVNATSDGGGSVHVSVVLGPGEYGVYACDSASDADGELNSVADNCKGVPVLRLNVLLTRHPTTTHFEIMSAGVATYAIKRIAHKGYAGNSRGLLPSPHSPKQVNPLA
jgi:uncharacterized protein (TIGR03790 family)